jgi:hypothetical protein
MKSLISLVVFSTFIASSLQAAPEESQRLRGLEGRTFAVEVTDLSGNPPPFSNCYAFNEDGSFDDPLFLPPPGPTIPGTWTQDSNGAKTGYTATAIVAVDEQFSVLLTQVGTVTPARGGGVLQLDAFNTVDLVLTDDPGIVIMALAQLRSVGHQDNQCGE